MAKTLNQSLKELMSEDRRLTRRINEDWNKKEVFFDLEAYGHIFRVEAKDVTISQTCRFEGEEILIVRENYIVKV